LKSCYRYLETRQPVVHKIEMSRKTIEVDSDMIDWTLEELAKLILRLDENPKKTRKDQNTIKKMKEIRDTLQDSVLYAKLKKSIQ
jgi:hypothetical protein